MNWLTCIHVMNGTAKEVWCRADGTAICAACAMANPDDYKVDDFAVLCPACMETALKAVAVVEGRELVERDAMGGHYHLN